MTICYFGNYNPEYARNRVLIRGLKENGINVIQCCEARFINLIKKHYQLPKYDMMILGYSDSRWTVILARLLCRRQLVWDAFYSLYDSWIFDRKLAKPLSIKAFYYWFMDWLGCLLADKILLDTEEHIKYFIKIFKIKKDKFIKVLVGTDDNNFFPKQEEGQGKNYFLIHFHGKFIPLQGAGYIVKAAKILEKENIRFRIIGSGQEYSNVKMNADRLGIKNIEWYNKVDYGELPSFMAEADLCLGVFGDTAKTQRVIPNKVYEAIAMAKPVITADTPAARELFADRENILFCRAADAEDLAAKILKIKNNKELKDGIAQGGYEIFEKFCTPKIIAENLLKSLN